MGTSFLVRLCFRKCAATRFENEASARVIDFRPGLETLFCGEIIESIKCAVCESFVKEQKPPFHSFPPDVFESAYEPDEEPAVKIAERMQCGIVEITDVGRGRVYPCSKTASGQCANCGIPVCTAHSDMCNLCNELFCATCLSFHRKFD